MAAEQATNQLRDAALDYARRGYRVLPLHSIRNGHCTCGHTDCSSPGKHPRTAHGLTDATINQRDIRHWWTRWPTANIGLATGVDSDLFVIDVDGTRGEASLEQLAAEHGALPLTRTSLTGRDGQHLVYRYPPGVEVGNSASKLGPGIDTRGLGGYIVAPPSFTEQQYEWLDPRMPRAALPEWIIDALTNEPIAPVVPLRPVATNVDSSGITNYARVALDGQALDVTNATQGQRNHTLNAAAFRMGQLVAGGQITESVVVDELTAAAAQCGLAGKEVADTIRSGLTSGAREPQYPDPARAHSTRAPRSVGAGSPAPQPPGPSTTDSPPVEPPSGGPAPTPPDNDDDPPPAPPRRADEPTDDDPEGEINETDTGNARRLIRRHGHELRYATHLRGWLRWDGQRWAPDQDMYVERCAQATAQSILSEAAAIDNEEKRKKRTAFSFKSEAAKALENAIKLAATQSGIPIGAGLLDADPWALNVLNGTVDLRTGELRAHEPTDLITKLAPVHYDPDAHDDRWDAYLESALRDDELGAWLARSVGYTLTGDTTEEVLFFVHGPTQSGKSTFLEAIKATLGDYAKNAEWETFLEQNHGGARPDIARLAGARLVTSNEVDEGRKLAEGLVKTLTGGDTITARFLYRDEFEYRPQFKLWLAANHKPKVRHSDDAIWRRIRLVPFTHPPAHVDPELKRHLTLDPHARSAILAWAIRGCAAWQREGLGSTNAVAAATDAYRREMDPLAEFFEERCTFSNDPECWVTGKELRKSYEEWATEQGYKQTLSPIHFKELLEERGCTKSIKRIDGKQARTWHGVRTLFEWENPEQLPGIAVTPVTERKNDAECDARDARDSSSGNFPNARAQEGTLENTRHARVARHTPTAATTPDEHTDTVRHCTQCGKAVRISRVLSDMTADYTCGDCRHEEPF